MKIPSCSTHGCTNRSDEGPEKPLSFHSLLFKNKKLAKKWLNQSHREARFRTKIRENGHVCNDQFAEECYDVSYRYEMLGATTRKNETKQNGHYKKFFVVTDTRDPFVPPPRSKIKSKALEVKINSLRLYLITFFYIQSIYKEICFL